MEPNILCAVKLFAKDATEQRPSTLCVGLESLSFHHSMTDNQKLVNITERAGHLLSALHFYEATSNNGNEADFLSSVNTRSTVIWEHLESSRQPGA